MILNCSANLNYKNLFFTENRLVFKSPDNQVIIPSQEVLDHADRLLQTKAITNTGISFQPLIVAMLEGVALNRDEAYRVFQIPKGRGKTRQIEAPNAFAKFLQKRILRVLNHTTLPNEVYGFRPGMDAYKGLGRMLDGVGAKGDLQSVYQTDIKDFFPSVKEKQVEEEVWNFLYRILHRWDRGPQLPQQLVKDLAKLITTICCWQGRLPQGGPTSPMLANMATTKCDRRICHELGDNFQYGRYADDIVIMGIEGLPKEQQLMVRNVLAAAGFKIANNKTEYKEGADRYKVWGVDVLPANEKQGLGLRFKLPARKEREYVGVIRELTSRDDLPKDPNAFMEHQEKIDGEMASPVKKILGYLSFAYHVTKHGRATRDQIYCLPKKLAFEWVKFLSKYKDRLPESFQKLFMHEGLEYVEVKKTIPATMEIFKGRQKNLCDKAELGDEGYMQFSADVQTEKDRITSMITGVSEEGVSCTEDEEDIDVAIADAFYDLAEWLDEQAGQVPNTEAEERILEATKPLIAMAELCMEDEDRSEEDKILKGIKRDESGESLLPKNIQDVWDEDFWPSFLKYLKAIAKDSNKIHGLRYLFWTKEIKKEVELQINPDTKKKKKRKPYLTLHGYGAPKKVKKKK